VQHIAFIFQHCTYASYVCEKMWTHSTNTETSFLLQNQWILCDEKSLEFKVNTFKLSSDVVNVKLGGKKAEIQALAKQLCLRSRDNPVRKLSTTCNESLLVDKPSAHSFLW